MSHDHDLHLSDIKSEKKAFYLAILIAFVFMLVEVIGGFIANSLALISDALHMFTDVGALALGLLVISVFNRPPNIRKSYGYQRAEVIGALISGAILWALMFFLIYEGIERLIHPHEVNGIVVFVIATIGLVANFIMMKLLHPGSQGSLNMEAAYLHVLGDLLGSIGVIISGLVIWLTNWYPIDPLITFFIAILILHSSGKMLKKALDILMEGVPKQIDYLRVKNDLLSIEGVKEVHDLHIWSLSSKRICLSCHLVTEDHEKNILNEAHKILKENHRIPHMTIQIESKDHFEKAYCYDCQNGLKS